MFNTFKELKKEDKDKKEDKKEKPFKAPMRKGESKFPPLPSGFSSNRPH